MSKVYVDSETCGLHSMMVLLQYAEEDGPIHLYDVWNRPLRETLRLIEWLCDNTVVGFNLAFDWFQIVKTYTTFRLSHSHGGRPETFLTAATKWVTQSVTQATVRPADRVFSRKSSWSRTRRRPDDSQPASKPAHCAAWLVANVGRRPAWAPALVLD